MTTFQAYIPLLLQAEGGYQNNPNDTGNWTSGKKGVGTLAGTNFGISAALYQRLYPDLEVTESVMRNLTKSEALDIYETHFWNKHRFGEMDSQNIANNIMDMALNAGPSTGIRLMQVELNRLGESLSTDGIIGALTLSAINRQVGYGNESVLFNAYTESRRNYYNTREDETFKGGWNNRLDRHFPPMSDYYAVSNTTTSPTNTAPSNIRIATDYIKHTTRSIFNVQHNASARKEVFLITLLTGLLILGMVVLLNRQIQAAF